MLPCALVSFASAIPRGSVSPKLLIEQAGLSDEVELRAEAGQIVIAAPRTARAGWADAARDAHTAGDDRLLETRSTRFDEEEWEW